LKAIEKLEAAVGSGAIEELWARVAMRSKFTE